MAKMQGNTTNAPRYSTTRKKGYDSEGTYFDVHGLDSFLSAAIKAGEIPKKVLKEAVKAKTEVHRKQQQLNAQRMLQGPYYTGTTARKVSKKNAVANKKSARMDISFKNTRYSKPGFPRPAKGNRNAEIAFVNEYGTNKQAARPFISDAILQSATKGNNEASYVLYAYFQGVGF